MGGRRQMTSVGLHIRRCMREEFRIFILQKLDHSYWDHLQDFLFEVARSLWMLQKILQGRSCGCSNVRIFLLCPVYRLNHVIQVHCPFRDSPRVRPLHLRFAISCSRQSSYECSKT